MRCSASPAAPRLARREGSVPASLGGMAQRITRPRAKSTAPRSRRATHAKRRFDFDVGLRRIRDMLKTLDVADAAMFELKDRGHGSVFEQLVACVISIRTRDEVMLPTALALFERAPTAEKLARLTEAQIDALIHAATF